MGGDRNLWAKDVIHKGLVALEALAKSLNAQDTLVGQISIAEIFLIPQLYNGRRFQVDLSAFPHLLRIENHVKSMDAFIKALPENQIDGQI
jgi:glutathione S-transferase